MACVHLTWSLQRSPVIQALSGSLVARFSRSSDRCLLHWHSPRSALGQFLAGCTPRTVSHSPGAVVRAGYFSCSRQAGTDKSVLQPDSRLTPLGFCTGYEALALVRPVVPYSLALSSKRARPVVSPAPSADRFSNPSFLQGCCPSSQALLSFTNFK